MERKLVIVHKHGIMIATAKKLKDNKNCYSINGYDKLAFYQEKNVSTSDTLFAFYCDKCKSCEDFIPQSDNYTNFFILSKKMENLINEFNNEGVIVKAYEEKNPDVNLLKQKDKNDYFYYMFCELNRTPDFDNNICIGTKQEKDDFFHRNYKRLTTQTKGIYFEVDTIEDTKTKKAELYDITIDIKSIDSLNNEGWSIEYPRTKEKYIEKEKKATIILGALGKQSKGKSFILGKLSGYDVPQGFTMQTKGISVRIGEQDNNCITIIDSAGQGKALLKENEEKSENEQLRDKLITERFIQEFVIHKQDIILLVVGIITIEEQKLLNNIKNLINQNKSLYVIHNLQNYHSRDQVEDYIENTLQKLFGIELEKIAFQNTLEKGYEYYFNEKNKNIIHLIFVNDYCEVANYYNNPVVDFLKQRIQLETNRTQFSVIEECKDYFMKMVNGEYLEKEITSDDFDIKDDKIKVKENKVVLRKVLVENIEKTETYIPSYCYYTENKDLIIKVELPGNNADIKSKITKENDYYIFHFQGTKPGSESDLKEKPVLSQN